MLKWHSGLVLLFSSVTALEPLKSSWNYAIEFYAFCHFLPYNSLEKPLKAKVP